MAEAKQTLPQYGPGNRIIFDGEDFQVEKRFGYSETDPIAGRVHRKPAIVVLQNWRSG